MSNARGGDERLATLRQDCPTRLQLYAALPVLKVTDVLTTYVGLRRGFTERNPIAAGLVKLGGPDALLLGGLLVAGWIVALAYVTERYLVATEHPSRVRLVRVLCVGVPAILWLGATVHNASLLYA